MFAIMHHSSAGSSGVMVILSWKVVNRQWAILNEALLVKTQTGNSLSLKTRDHVAFQLVAEIESLYRWHEVFVYVPDLTWYSVDIRRYFTEILVAIHIYLTAQFYILSYIALKGDLFKIMDCGKFCMSEGTNSIGNS